MIRRFEKLPFFQDTFKLLCLLYLIPYVYALSGCFSLDFILRRARTSCIVAFVTDGCTVVEHYPSKEYEQFQYIRNLLLSNKHGILVGFIDINDAWPDGSEVTGKHDVAINIGDIVLFEKITKDRTEIYPTAQPQSIAPLVLRNVYNIEELIQFINQGCNTYLHATGGLSKQGLYREEILQSKFYVKNVSNVQSKDVFLQKCSEKNDNFCYSDRNLHVHVVPKLPECERIQLPTRDDFFHKYLKKSKPVIFKEVLKDWPAFTKWSNKYLREKYGGQEIMFQLTPQGEFENIEPMNIWENYQKFKFPRSCADQILTPDLVMVRPATESKNLSVFMDILDGISNGSIVNMSAYLEYASIPRYLPELEKDIQEEVLFKGLLEREMLNIWLSDGRTLGKLHFDPYDNFLCQISGGKQVILFDPHNNHQLYEGHIQEASMSYNFTSKSFQRRYLLDNTVQAFSPVDIMNPNYTRFPLFGETYPLNCTLEEGDVLYLPSFWWHEVQSFPNITAGRNLAINFWYEPFLTRDYPCPECQLDVNPKYRHLL